MLRLISNGDYQLFSHKIGVIFKKTFLTIIIRDRAYRINFNDLEIYYILYYFSIL